MTGTSTLDPDNFPERPDRSLGKGHGTTDQLARAHLVRLGVSRTSNKPTSI